MALGVIGTLLLIKAAVGAPAIMQATTNAPTAAGVWQQVDDDGNVGALVTITGENGIYEGQLSRCTLGLMTTPTLSATNVPGRSITSLYLASFSLRR